MVLGRCQACGRVPILPGRHARSCWSPCSTWNIGTSKAEIPAVTSRRPSAARSSPEVLSASLARAPTPGATRAWPLTSDRRSRRPHPPYRAAVSTRGVPRGTTGRIERRRATSDTTRGRIGHTSVVLASATRTCRPGWVSGPLTASGTRPASSAFTRPDPVVPADEHHGRLPASRSHPAHTIARDDHPALTPGSVVHTRRAQPGAPTLMTRTYVRVIRVGAFGIGQLPGTGSTSAR